MVEEVFRLPLSSYDQLVRIIRAYASMNQPSSPDVVANAAALHPTIVSRNNAFLVAIGVLDRGQKKSLNEKGRALARALEYQRADEVRNLWRQLVLGNEFLEKLVTAVRIRQGMEASTLQAHIAYSAGQPRRPDIMVGAGAIVDILKTAGLLKEDDGKLVAADEMDQPSPVEEAPEPEKPKPQPTIKSIQLPPLISVLPSGFSVVVDVQIRCTPEDLNELAPKIRKLIDDLKKSIDEHSTGE